MARHLTRTAGAILATALLVTACGGTTADPDPAPPSATPSASPSSTPSDGPSPTSDPSPVVLRADDEMAALEETFDARLGVFALDTGTGTVLEHRADERFAYASTIKAPLAAVVLDQHTIGELDGVVEYTEADLVTYSPVTEEHVGTGLSVGELAAAAVQQSDNGAANLLLDRVGGTSGLGEALRAAGDDVTQVDRTEPDLNEATPGDPRDTTTPRALATTLETFALGDGLPPEKQELLVGWLQGNTTGDDLVRAVVPEGWTVGDKTGSGGYGTRNDVAIVWPPDGDPLVIAIMTSRDTADATRDDALLAEAAAVVLDQLAGT
ncbi:class A beta-lactamase [Oerskovia flava]|uniref:class A beta-lactamase n=1 Tax=Oerskovia flava TaxID=2986422 RepID=UPI002240B266|nr:class A beta-lactamase [Oerskovia sp. JB1-3-2]